MPAGKRKVRKPGREGGKEGREKEGERERGRNRERETERDRDKERAFVARAGSTWSLFCNYGDSWAGGSGVDNPRLSRGWA